MGDKLPTAKILSGKQVVRVIAVRPRPPPRVYANQTLRLLCARLVELEIVELITHMAVRSTPNKVGPEVKCSIGTFRPGPIRSSLMRQCFHAAASARCPMPKLQAELAAWPTDVNAPQRGVNWQVGFKDAPGKLKSSTQESRCDRV